MTLDGAEREDQEDTVRIGRLSIRIDDPSGERELHERGYEQQFLEIFEQTKKEMSHSALRVLLYYI